MIVLVAETPEPSDAVALTVTEPAETPLMTHFPPDVVSDVLEIVAYDEPDVMLHVTWRSVADVGDVVAVKVNVEPLVTLDDP